MWRYDVWAISPSRDQCGANIDWFSTISDININQFLNFFIRLSPFIFSQTHTLKHKHIQKENPIEALLSACTGFEQGVYKGTFRDSETQQCSGN